MIKSFRHKGLERLFMDDIAGGIDARQRAKLLRLLDRLDAATQADDMNLPGWGFHSLIGDRQQQYSVKVTRNWRLTFEFTGCHAYYVNLEDYH